MIAKLIFYIVCVALNVIAFRLSYKFNLINPRETIIEPNINDARVEHFILCLIPIIPFLLMSFVLIIHYVCDVHGKTIKKFGNKFITPIFDFIMGKK